MNKGFSCFFVERTGIHLFYTYLAKKVIARYFSAEFFIKSISCPPHRGVLFKESIDTDKQVKFGQDTAKLVYFREVPALQRCVL